MAQNLNSVRKHYLAPWTSDTTKPTETDYKWLASGITTMGNDSEDVTEDYNDYTGIDTTDVLGIRKRWSPEGFVDYEDDAQKIVIDKEFAIGNGRKVWHKWVSTDGTTYEGVARLLDIKIAGGDSNTKEELSFVIQHDGTPEKTPEG
jgi:hypothetical protein